MYPSKDLTAAVIRRIPAIFTIISQTLSMQVRISYIYRDNYYRASQVSWGSFPSIRHFFLMLIYVGMDYSNFNRRMKARKQVKAYLPNRQKLTLKLHRNQQQEPAENKSQAAPIISINPAKISEKIQSPFKIRQINKENSNKQIPTHTVLTVFPQKRTARTPSADLSHQNTHKNDQKKRTSQMSYVIHNRLSSETAVQQISIKDIRKRATSLDHGSKSKLSTINEKQKRRSLDEIMVFLHRQGFIDSADQAYSMRKDKLFQLFSGIRFYDKGGKEDKMGQLLSFLHRISASRQRISIHSQVFSLNLNSTVVLESFSHFHFKVEKLMAQEIVLSQNIASKEKILSTLILQIQEKSDLLQNRRVEADKLLDLIEEKRKNCIEIENRIEGLSQKLLSVEEEYNMTLNFCQRQEKNKILKIIAKQFKQIQSQIFEYAVYLQSNQMAHDISFEPKPFQEMERLMLASLAELSKELLDNKTKTIERKCKQMTDFLHDCINKFHKKDVEIGKLTEFRTKCVHTFINKMKLWLENWELKQEYLVNLKKEFIANHSELLTILATPVRDGNCKCHIHFQNAVTIVKRLWENFNYSNSFY